MLIFSNHKIASLHCYFHRNIALIVSTIKNFANKMVDAIHVVHRCIEALPKTVFTERELNARKVSKSVAHRQALATSWYSVTVDLIYAAFLWYDHPSQGHLQSVKLQRLYDSARLLRLLCSTFSYEIEIFAPSNH